MEADSKDKKLPAMQFYPGDWRKDLGVQALSFHDRGVWVELLMMMHESERRGVLVLNGKAMSDDMIARAIGLDIQTFKETLSTLLATGVASREHETGAVMNRRMVRDEALRKIRVESGSKGGNPLLVKQKPTIRDNETPTPSLSFPSANSIQEQKTGAKRSSAPMNRPSVSSLFKNDYDEVFQTQNHIQAPWDAKEATCLARWIKANPTVTREQWQTILKNRVRSPVNHAAPLSKWIGNALAWLNGIADDWGKKPKAGADGNRAQQRTASNLEAARAVFERDDTSRPAQLSGGAAGSREQGNAEHLPRRTN